MSSSAQKHESKRAELIRRLIDLTPKRRADALLEEVDGRALVRSIPAEDVYSTIVEVGLADSTEIVQLATVEQFRTFVDLAAWQRDRLDPLEVLRWLRAARGDDDEAFIRKLQGLDLEVVELVYKKLSVLHDLEEDPDVNPEGVTMETPEGRYLVEFKVDGVDEAALRRLTFDLMAHNPFELSRFLEAVRWEMPMELEETAFKFREARLQDLGFPPLEEAIRIFSWVDPDQQPRAAGAPTTALGSTGHVDSVGAAFRGLDETERLNLESEVRGLVNRVLVAEGAEPGDPPAVKRASEHARDYLDLGLEHLTHGDAERAAEVVRARPLTEIFQVGFSLTLKLRRQVERLAREEGARFGDTWLALDEETAVLAALLRKRPLKALRVPGAEPVPFRSKRELAEVEQLLGRVRQQQAVLRGLLGATVAQTVAQFGVSLADLRPQRLFAAVVARAELDGLIEVAPFPALRLTELCARLFDDAGKLPTLRPSAGSRAVALLTERLGVGEGELPAMVARVLSGWLQDLGQAWARDGRVDAARVESLPIEGQLVV
jgi:hypothetical protein